MDRNVLDYGRPPARKRSNLNVALGVGLALSACGWLCHAAYHFSGQPRPYLLQQVNVGGSWLTFAGLVFGVWSLNGPDRWWSLIVVAIEVVIGCAGLEH